ncbi:unnamed protein product [Closterium sp. NIES-54]
MATPSVLPFDAEGRAVDFEVWVDDLQLFLQCDRADGLSLFDLTSGASPALPATAYSTVRSQWATRDAAARLAVRRHLPTTERAHFSQYRSAQTLYDAVVARYSSPANAALSRLILPYLFPDLAAFPTVADLITHLRTSDTRYRAALPAELCAKNPPPPWTTSSQFAEGQRRGRGRATTGPLKGGDGAAVRGSDRAVERAASGPLKGQRRGRGKGAGLRRERRRGSDGKVAGATAGKVPGQRRGMSPGQRREVAGAATGRRRGSNGKAFDSPSPGTDALPSVPRPTDTSSRTTWTTSSQFAEGQRRGRGRATTGPLKGGDGAAVRGGDGAAERAASGPLKGRRRGRGRAATRPLKGRRRGRGRGAMGRERGSDEAAKGPRGAWKGDNEAAKGPRGARKGGNGAAVAFVDSSCFIVICSVLCRYFDTSEAF